MQAGYFKNLTKLIKYYFKMKVYFLFQILNGARDILI